MKLYFYKVKEITKIVDGDTVDILIDLGFNIIVKQRIRLLNYDAPETYRPETKAEYDAGEKCKKYLTHLINKYKDKLYVRTSKHVGKYGRYLGELFYKKGDNYTSINELMINYIAENNFYKSVLRKDRCEEKSAQ